MAIWRHPGAVSRLHPGDGRNAYPYITNHGHGVRVYPSPSGGTPIIVNAIKRTCTGDNCENIGEPCADLWEDDFRFGKYRDAEFVLPPRTTRIREKGKAWSAIERYMERPNPIVDGIQYATHMKHARIQTPKDSRTILRDMSYVLRAKRRQKMLLDGIGTPVGRSLTDLYAVATLAVERIGNEWSYERTQDEIDRLVGEGYLNKAFRFPRINEQMIELPLSGVLLEMRDHLMGYFRDVGRIGVIDGTILSTNKADNPAAGTFSSKSVRVELHVLYDVRWGFIIAFSLTWHARGRGSGEAPQYPFIVHEAKMLLPHLKMIQGDLAYGSANNFAHTLNRGMTLLVPVRPNAFKKQRLPWLTKEQVEYIRRHNDPSGPLIQQVFRFRNGVEMWNSSQKAVMSRHLMTNPDRSLLPKTKVDAKKFRSCPRAWCMSSAAL